MLTQLFSSSACRCPHGRSALERRPPWYAECADHVLYTRRGARCLSSQGLECARLGFLFSLRLLLLTLLLCQVLLGPLHLVCAPGSVQLVSTSGSSHVAAGSRALQRTFHEADLLLHVVAPSDEACAGVATASALVCGGFGVASIHWFALEVAVFSALEHHRPRLEARVQTHAGRQDGRHRASRGGHVARTGRYPKRLGVDTVVSGTSCAF